MNLQRCFREIAQQFRKGVFRRLTLSLLVFILAFSLLKDRLIIQDTLPYFDRSVKVSPQHHHHSTAGCKRPFNDGPVLLVWAYDEWQTQAAQSALNTISSDTETHVWCGSTACLKELQPPSPCWQVHRLHVYPLAESTPVQGWAEHHVLAKLQAGFHFEDQLQVAMQLAALYKYGGAVLHMMQVETGMQQQPARKEDLGLLEASSSVVSPYGGLWYAACQKAAPVIETWVKASLSFVENSIYNDDAWLESHYKTASWPFRVDWDATLQDAKATHKLGVSSVEIGNIISKPTNTKSFATLNYDSRKSFLLSRGNPGMNIGDEMQGLAGIQFLPRLDAFLERDRLDIVRFTDSIELSDSIDTKTPATVWDDTANRSLYAFLNAWWGTPTMVWPPPDYIKPITVAMHFQPGTYQRLGSDPGKFFETNRPIGARDTKTSAFLTGTVKVDTVFTACMTMSLTMPPVKERTGGVLVVDVTNKEKLNAVIPSDVPVTSLSHKMLGNLTGNCMARFHRAYEKLQQYRNAQVVVTERLHSALPAVAMGTPVIFLDSENLIGGGGSRLQGLEGFMHFVYKGMNSTPTGFEWTAPLPNPNGDAFQKFSTTIKHIAACHEGITDSALKFGMVPPSWKVLDDDKPCDRDGQISPSSIHIATVVDGNFLHRVFPTWVNSLAKSNKDENIVLYVLTYQISPKQLCLMKHLVYSLFPQAKLFTLNANFLDEKAKKNYRGLGHITVATQARLYLSSLLPCVDKIIWMDLDALAVRSLRSLWDLPVPSCGVVGRNSIKNFLDKFNSQLGFVWSNTYAQGFNAGVVLMSLNKLRDQHFEHTLVPYWAEQKGLNDQILLNLACNGTHAFLPAEHNVFMHYPEEHTPDVSKWVVAHFQGVVKPWERSVEKRFQQIWDENSISFEDGLGASI